jgi:hypothetical protein
MLPHDGWRGKLTQIIPLGQYRRKANYYPYQGTLKLLKTLEDVDPRHGLNDLDIFSDGILVKNVRKLKSMRGRCRIRFSK